MLNHSQKLYMNKRKHSCAVPLPLPVTKMLAAEKLMLKDTRSNPSRPGKIIPSFVLLQIREETGIWGIFFK